MISILGLETCLALNLIGRIQTIQDSETLEIKHTFIELFAGFFKWDKIYKMELNETKKPIICATRKILLALRNTVQKEWEKLVNLDIIKTVEEPTKWVN